MLQKITPDSVEQGMFIVELGGSWFDHPFWKKRFIVENASDLARLRSCKVPYVLIDTSRGSATAPDRGSEQVTSEAEQVETDVRGVSGRRIRTGKRAARSCVRRLSSGTPEKRSARAMVRRAGIRIRGVFDQVDLGWRVDHRVIDDVLDDIEREVAQNPEALLAVIGLKTKDNYTYLHSVAVCTLMVCIARQKGLPASEVRDLGKAGLLHDIGKVRVGDAILKKAGELTDDEYRLARSHARHGFDLLREVPDVPATALDVCLHHHEKMDGSGYPEGLSADQISYAARLAAVCDVYDALTSTRPYKKRWSREEAIGAMWSWDGHFDRAVLADLMRVTQIYPANILLRLANGNLAVTKERALGDLRLHIVEFFSTASMEWLTPSQNAIERKDLASAVLRVEQAEDWGFDEWETVRNRITDALSSSAPSTGSPLAALSA
jgi:HD-GYP domain-containing protein (c-di-GMP phosphodiesterase class II)